MFRKLLFTTAIVLLMALCITAMITAIIWFQWSRSTIGAMQCFLQVGLFPACVAIMVLCVLFLNETYSS